MTGLRYGNTSGLCAACYQRLPAIAKASRSGRVDVIVRRYAARMVEVYGLPDAAVITGLDPKALAEAARGGDSTGSRGPSDEVTGPMGGLVWRPWQVAAQHVLGDESDGARIGRERRAGRRASLLCYVPPVDAPLDPAEAGNAYGKTRRGARPRALLPMRVAVGLWGRGLGPKVIGAVAARVDVAISTSAIGRLLQQTWSRFDGAVVARVGDLSERVTGAAERSGRMGPGIEMA